MELSSINRRYIGQVEQKPDKYRSFVHETNVDKFENASNETQIPMNNYDAPSLVCNINFKNKKLLTLSATLVIGTAIAVIMHKDFSKIKKLEEQLNASDLVKDSLIKENSQLKENVLNQEERIKKLYKNQTALRN